MQRVSDHIRDIHWARPSIETAMRLVLNGGGVVLRWYSKTIDGVWKLRIHPVGLSTVLVVLALFFFPVEPWCRLMLPPSMADVRALAERAPLVFRGHVLTVTPIRTNTEAGARVESIAKIQIDRWYRGNGSTEALLRFAHSGEIFADGHDFRPETYWTVFAVEKNGQMEMIDDDIRHGAHLGITNLGAKEGVSAASGFDQIGESRAKLLRAPSAHGINNGFQSFTARRELIFHAWWDLWVDTAVQQPVPLHLPKLLRQNLGSDP